MPQGGLEALTTQDPGDILAYQYGQDLVCNGVELSSGAVRNHLPEVMEAAFAIAGYGPDRIKESFPSPCGTPSTTARPGPTPASPPGSTAS